MGLTWRDPLYMDAGMEKKISRLLVNSFGFGGHNGVAAFQKFEG